MITWKLYAQRKACQKNNPAEGGNAYATPFSVGSPICGSDTGQAPPKDSAVSQGGGSKLSLQVFPEGSLKAEQR